MYSIIKAIAATTLLYQANNAAKIKIFPSDGVYLFNDGCPDGFELIKKSIGRSPRGAGGQYSEIVDFNGVLVNQSVTYSGNETGGKMWHTLSLDQIPPHDHGNNGYNRVLQDGTGGQGSSGGDNDPDITDSRTLLPNGNGQPHNNLSPYWTDYHCKPIDNGKA